MRLIDADTVKDILNNDAYGMITKDGVELGISLEEALSVVDDCPTIDAVEVVRCKDCKHRYISGNGTTRYYLCDFMDAQYEDDGFCHHGKRDTTA